MKMYGEWRYSSTILNLGTRWMWVVSFTPRPFYLLKTGLGTHCIGDWVQYFMTENTNLIIYPAEEYAGI
jgi:hypothetical protein